MTYHIEGKIGDQEIFIVNDDEEGIIDYIKCICDEPLGRKLWSVKIWFKENRETDEARSQFLAIKGTQSQGRKEPPRKDYEELLKQEDMKTIVEYFKIIQKIDPLPLSVFSKEELAFFDLSEILTAGLIEDRVTQGKHVEALQIALAADAKGDDQALVVLANLYSESGDMENYRNVLTKYPKTHREFASASASLHDLSLSSSPSIKNADDKIKSLENKFKLALQSDQTRLAAQYFDELCGKSGLNPQISDVKGDPDTLIQIARVQRGLNKEIEELKSYKSRSEAARTEEKEEKSLPPFFKPK